MTSSRTPRPLTVIGGFLGAGKTTFLNRMLTHAHGRYAVLVNDFGAVNVDAALVAAHDGQTLRLTNGCVCCSIGDDFMGTLIRVLDADEPFDRIVVEASGVADPRAIADIARLEPDLASGPTIVLVDAECIAALLDDTRLRDTIVRQIAAADTIVLNKLDLVSDEMVTQACARIAEIVPAVVIVPAVAADVDIDALAGPAPDRPAPSRFRADALHEQQFHRILYRREGCFSRERLEAVLPRLPPTLWRLKGLCRFADSGDAWLLQCVGQRHALSHAPKVSDSGWPIELVGIASEAADISAVPALLDEALRP